jgi:hypothetical protein
MLQSNLRGYSRKDDFSWSTLYSRSSKRRWFVFLQMLHINKIGMTFHMASLECLHPCVFQHWSSSTILLGMTHEVSNKMRIKCHILLVNSQWMKKWFTISSLFVQIQHQLTRVRPCLLKLSIVRILLKATIQVKKTIQGESFHLPNAHPRK